MDTLEEILALPDEIVQNPDNEFNLVFHSYSWLKYVIAIALLMVSGGFIIPFLSETEIIDTDQVIIGYGIVAVFSFFVFFGFMQSLQVICIILDKRSATFYGSKGKKRLHYKRIHLINNDRYINGRGRILGTGGFWGLGYPRPSMDQTSIASSNMLDSSSTSPAFTNTISVSSIEGTVSFTFSGGGNKGFVTALAIIIYYSRMRNPNCNVSPTAIKAAAKSIDLL